MRQQIEQRRSDAIAVGCDWRPGPSEHLHDAEYAWRRGDESECERHIGLAAYHIDQERQWEREKARLFKEQFGRDLRS